MKQFLTPFNINFYDAIRAYNELEEIDWTIRAKMSIGDEVYFYCSAPIKKILFKGIVTDVNVKFQDMIEDGRFYKKESDKKCNNGFRYTRIKLSERLSDEKTNLLTFNELKEHGLKGPIQKTLILDNNQELYTYINDIC